MREVFGMTLAGARIVSCDESMRKFEGEPVYCLCASIECSHDEGAVPLLEAEGVGMLVLESRNEAQSKRDLIAYAVTP